MNILARQEFPGAPVCLLRHVPAYGP